MDFQTICQIDITNKLKRVLMRVFMSEEHIDICAGIIVDQMKKYPKFKEAMFEYMIDRFGTIVLTK